MKIFTPRESNKLGEILYNNEIAFSLGHNSSFDVKSSSYRKRLFCSFTFDGDLYDWIFKKDKTTTTFDAINQKLISSGFPSMKELASKYYNERKGQLNRISLKNLIIGVKYSLWDICALAKNFNQLLGMYASNDNLGNPVAIIKATINGNQFRSSNYADNWVGNDHVQMRYFLQKENDIVDYNFKNETNRLIFDGLINALPVPIYLFYNEEKGIDYTYAGIYTAGDISPDRKAFDIFQKDSIQRRIKDKDRIAFLKQYAKQLPELWKDKPIKECPVPRFFENQQNNKTITTKRNPDYLELEELKKIIGDLGEKEAIKIETKRLNEINHPELISKVSKTLLDSDGFDIRSVDVRGPEIRDIKIEVKTTSSPIGNCPFFMSENERKTMAQNPDDYWLYRIFDTHGANIKYFALRENVADKLNLFPENYKVTLK